MAKLVDAPSSGGGAARCAGSNPVPGTRPSLRKQRGLFVWKLHYSHVHYIYHVSKINIKRLNNGGKTKKVNNKFKQEINITM